MHRDVIKQLKNLRHEPINPREEWVQSNRAVLLAQVKNTMPVRTSVSMRERISAITSVFLSPSLIYGAVRPIAAIVAIAVVATTAYTGTVRASYDSLPGDWLYPAKRAAEKTQVVMTELLGNQGDVVKVHVQLAKNRVAETQQILNTNDPQKTQKAAATVADLKSEITAVASNLTVTQTDNSGQVQAQVAKDVTQDAQQIKAALQQVKNTLVANPVGDPSLTKEVTETKDLVKDVSVQAVEVMVNQHLAGDTTVSKAEVNQTISSTLQGAVSDVDTSKQSVDGAKNLLQTAQTQVQDLSGQIKKKDAKDPGLIAGVQEVRQQIQSVSNQTVAAAIKTEAATAQVLQSASEAQQLLNNGDFAQAVDKVKQANQATQVAEQLSDSTIANVQTVLPVVQVVKNDTVIGTTTIQQVLPMVASSSLPVTVTIATSTTSTVPIFPIPQIIFSTSTVTSSAPNSKLTP